MRDVSEALEIFEQLPAEAQQDVLDFLHAMTEEE